jgi:L-asparaginase/Glu-tRNA(Gln) amidotransferase subunit D
MAYTASALAFLLADLPKPVVLTGAQIPLCEYSSDATNNFRGALLSAGMKDLPGMSRSLSPSYSAGDYQEESSLG